MTNCEQKAEKFQQLQTRVSILKTAFTANNYQSRNKSDFDDFLKYVREILNIRKELKELQNWLSIFKFENGTEIELGPTFEKKMTLDEAFKTIEDFNKTLPKGEKPRRLPTREELMEIGKPIKEIWNENLSLEEREKKIDKYIQPLGFVSGSSYWTSTLYARFQTDAWYWYSYNGHTIDDSKRFQHSVRCVR